MSLLARETADGYLTLSCCPTCGGALEHFPKDVIPVVCVMCGWEGSVRGGRPVALGEGVEYPPLKSRAEHRTTYAGKPHDAGHAP